MSRDRSFVRRKQRPVDNYTQVHNTLARDVRLTPQAKGIALWLLSHSSEYRFSIATIAAAMGCGRDLVKAAVANLEQHGYLERTPIRDAGRLVGMEYVLDDNPQVGTNDGFSVDGSTAAGESTGKEEHQLPEEPTPSGVGDSYQLELVPSQKPSVEGDQQPARTRDTRTDPTAQWVKPKSAGVDMFDVFWRAYPRRVGKLAAHRQWLKALKAGVDVGTLIDAATRYANECEGREAQFIKHPSTWLSNGCWDDEPAPAVKPQATAGVYRDKDMWTPEVIADMKRKYPGSFSTPKQGGVTVR